MTADQLKLDAEVLIKAASDRPPSSLAYAVKASFFAFGSGSTPSSYREPRSGAG